MVTAPAAAARATAGGVMGRVAVAMAMVKGALEVRRAMAGEG